MYLSYLDRGFMGGAEAWYTWPGMGDTAGLGLAALWVSWTCLGLNFLAPVGVETSFRLGVDLKMSLVMGRISESRESTTASKVKNSSVT